MYYLNIFSENTEKTLDQVDFLHFTQTLATFRRTEAKHSCQLSTVDQKIRCRCIFSLYIPHNYVLCTLVVFRVYDTDNDGYISKDDLIHVSVGYHNVFTVVFC